ncbi:MAG: hypothetical protein QM204_04130, partial [Bacillota bacterium]|nr:hypothetical protein [Bacillota bacterium]NLL25902.1 hypothetical protein [Erysipelotrichia bacterium]
MQTKKSSFLTNLRIVCFLFWLKNDKITVVRNEVKAMTMRRSSIKDNSMMLRSIEEVVPKDHL